MNYLMVDISGRVLNYDVALCEAIFKILPKEDHLMFFATNIDSSKIDCPSKKLVSLIPKSLKNSENIFKRGLKALEGIVNYSYLILYIAFHKVEILHLQWLPFLEICSVEKIFLKMIKFISPKTKVFLTVHNLYPHNSSVSQKKAYQNRFGKIQKYIDKYILHLEVSKKEFCCDFSIDESKTVVIPHGIFEPKGYAVQSHMRGEKLNLIMYGNQSYYKGTDILVDALNLLPKECQEKIHTVIVGKIAPNYYASLKKKTEQLDVEWIPTFVSDEVLYDKIAESDVIVIPYREISQSGVLLLALYFNRIIIVSDLPSFKETLSECSNDLFFESENPQSLCQKLVNLINNAYLKDYYIRQLENVKKNNLWISSAQKTLDHYKQSLRKPYA